MATDLDRLDLTREHLDRVASALAIARGEDAAHLWALVRELGLGLVALAHEARGPARLRPASASSTALTAPLRAPHEPQP